MTIFAENTYLLPQDIQLAVKTALEEDIGAGDVTAQLIDPNSMSIAKVITREEAVICGIAWFNEVFCQIDPTVQIHWEVKDGQHVAPNQQLCRLQGNSRALLTGERSALNFLQLLSGTATQARHYAQLIAGTKARILDTRKTIPCLRKAQKYAVLCGGGCNHRLGLYDMFLIKENHIAAAGSIAAAVKAARQIAPNIPLEVEVENLTQLQQALDIGVDRVLLDNFDLAMLRTAVLFANGRAQMEASGNVNTKTIRAIAETGVDFISIGSITKDIKAIDLSMRFV